MTRYHYSLLPTIGLVAATAKGSAPVRVRADQVLWLRDRLSNWTPSRPEFQEYEDAIFAAGAEALTLYDLRHP